MTDVIPIEDYEAKKGRALIKARPYTWPDPINIPPRQWLYGQHLARGFVSVTLAPGGVGKSSLLMVEALAMAFGQPLVGVKPHAAMNVWYVNLEDPLDELNRRFAAAAKHFRLDANAMRGRLFVNSGRETALCIARQEGAAVVFDDVAIDRVRGEINDNQIDVMIVDPFVSVHRVGENDNNAIDAVAKKLAAIADETACGIELVHHARKLNGEEISAESSRGASALIAASRSCRILAPMTTKEAEDAGVTESPRRYFYAANGKANLAPPPESKFWFRLEGVNLDNGSGDYMDGDNVAVVTAWRWPDAFAEVTLDDLKAIQHAISKTSCRADPQATAWAGIVVADVLGLDTADKSHRQRIKKLLLTWTANGMFRLVQKEDNQRRVRTFLEVAEWA